MRIADTASRFTRRCKLGHTDNQKCDWVRIASVVLGISLLVNVFTITILYKYNSLGVRAGLSREENEIISIMNRRHTADMDAEDYHVDDYVVGYEWRRLSTSSGHGSSSNAGNSTSSSSGSSSNAGNETSSGHGSGSHVSSGHGSGDGHHGPHQHDSLLYLFNAIVIGALVMQVQMRFPMLQQTVMLFVLGFIFSILMHGFKLSDKAGVFGESYEMWMNIDPHLLLFTLLPALLAGDAMTIDTFVAKKVYLQCLWLAAPGVLVGGFSAATFLWWYLDWNYWLCLCAGAILCATDPVAVVALLKELGASPMLTVQIQGESLLNDGTAIVLYLISYELLRGETFEWTDVAEFLIKKALMAWALGLFIGYFFFYWIWFADNKLDHGSSMIQIVLTLTCAYWSFIFVEGVLELSGVLATVASSLVLAAHMWPYIAFPDSMHHVWHTFESLGNIVIFALAGSITGKIVVDIDAIDYLHLIVIYFVLLIVRAFLIFGCRPILSYLSMVNQPVSWQEAAVMTWGGLRGAVGLALAISVRNDRAPHVCTGVEEITVKDSERLLFYVSGIAFLTMVVNATTAPTLVSALGITATSEARRKLLHMFHSQLVLWSIKGDAPTKVTGALQHMLDEAMGEIDSSRTSEDGPKVELKVRKSSAVSPEEAMLRVSSTRAMTRPALMGKECYYQMNKDLISELERQKATTWELLKAMYSNTEARDDYDLALRLVLGDEHLVIDAVGGTSYMANRLPGVDKQNPLGDVEGIKKLLVEYEEVDTGMAKVINKTFLQLVNQNYWNQIDKGSLRPGPESEILITSVRMSMSPYRPDLMDFGYLEQKLALDAAGATQKTFTEEEMDGLDDEDNDSVTEEQKQSRLASLVGSSKFGILVMVMILLNSIQVLFEEALRHNCTEKCGTTCETKDIDNHVMWLILDTIFTSFFTVEFLLKFAWLLCDYFHTRWNQFDFFLVCTGIFGLVFSLATHGKEADLANKTRIIRVARVLRTLRFLRVLRLFNARMRKDKFVSMELANRMKTIMVLSCFIAAQLKAQVGLVEFFGGNGEIDEDEECELGRCILQSQVHVYKALYGTAWTYNQMGEAMTRELEVYTKRKKITENLRQFVSAAQEAGALSYNEAHKILHPLDHEVAHCMKVLSERADGVMRAPPETSKPQSPRPLNAAQNGSQSLTAEGATSEATPLPAVPMVIGVPEPPPRPPPVAASNSLQELPPTPPAPLPAPSAAPPQFKPSNHETKETLS